MVSRGKTNNLVSRTTGFCYLTSLALEGIQTQKSFCFCCLRSNPARPSQLALYCQCRQVQYYRLLQKEWYWPADGELLSTQREYLTAQAKAPLVSMQHMQSMLSFDQHILTLLIVWGKTYATRTKLQLRFYTALWKPREMDDDAPVLQRQCEGITTIFHNHILG